MWWIWKFKGIIIIGSWLYIIVILDNHITDEGAEYLSERLVLLPKLHVLHLTCNYIENQDFIMKTKEKYPNIIIPYD